MRCKQTFEKFFVFILVILFVIKFSARQFLRLYIQAGIGSCEDIPILCKAPTQEISNPPINKAYIETFIPYKFPKMFIRLPKGFNVTQETVKKYYYKRKGHKWPQADIYLVYQPPQFFINLFPEVKQRGISDNYTFIASLISARTNYIQGVLDTFFVIMKGIFTPDIGDQDMAVMAQFSLADRKGFINYNLGRRENYFDCNVITADDSFFKIYIKDKTAGLDLDKVLAIISTVKAVI